MIPGLQARPCLEDPCPPVPCPHARPGSVYGIRQVPHPPREEAFSPAHAALRSRFFQNRSLPCWRAPPAPVGRAPPAGALPQSVRSEEHTSELQSLMRISYAVFCLKKKKTIPYTNN